MFSLSLPNSNLDLTFLRNITDVVYVLYNDLMLAVFIYIKDSENKINYHFHVFFFGQKIDVNQNNFLSHFSFKTFTLHSFSPQLCSSFIFA
jgi:plasmid rolling circle replication initiator protein Rep